MSSVGKLALITGASSGIGAAFARRHAKKGGHSIIVARREDKLHALKEEIEAEYETEVHVIAADLSGRQAAEDLYARVTGDGHEIDYLINNAGFGGRGAFLERDLDDDMAMIDLNVIALVTLCHRFGADMKGRGSGRILNVGSTAGMMPGPNQAVYFASKAFVNSFSQALSQELKDSGVTVTVLAPGYVETEFADRADLRGTGLANQSGATADQVARVGYDAMTLGQLLVVNQASLAFMTRFVIPFLPRRAAMAMIQKMQTK